MEPFTWKNFPSVTAIRNTSTIRVTRVPPLGTKQKTQSIWPIKIHQISSFFLLFQILILLGEEPSFLLCTREFIHQYNHPNYPCKLRQNYLWYTLRGNQSLNFGKLSLLKQNLASSMSKIQKCITEIPFALVYWSVLWFLISSKVCILHRSQISNLWLG